MIDIIICIAAGLIILCLAPIVVLVCLGIITSIYVNIVDAIEDKPKHYED